MHSSLTVVVAALAASASAWGIRGGPYGALPADQGYGAAPSSDVKSSGKSYQPTGVAPTEGYTIPTGKGPYVPSGYPKPPSTGESPIGSGVGPAGTGGSPGKPGVGPTGTGAPYPPYGSGTPNQPIGSGSGIVGPTGTGSGGSPITFPPAIETTTIYGSDTTTKTITSTGTITQVSTITTYVPCSTLVSSTSGMPPHYSTYVSLSYSTTTVTATTTKIQVICPSTTPASQPSSYPSPGAGNTGSSSPVNANNGNTGSNDYSSGANSPVGGNAPKDQSYKPTTVFGPASAATSGTCAPAQTVYSTVVATVTSGASSPKTPCSVCQTYTLTLPNGAPYTAVVTPTSGAGPQDTAQPGSGSPPYPYPGQGGSGAQGSGSSYIRSNGPTAAPIPTGKYPGYGYGRKMHM